MATASQIENLKTAIEKIKTIDKVKLSRAQLGEESLKTDLEALLGDLMKKTQFAIQYAPGVFDNYVSQAASIFNRIGDLFQQQSDRNSADYITNRQAFLNTFVSLREELSGIWTHFIGAAIQSRGLLEDEGIKIEYERAVEDMQNQANKAITQIKKQADDVIVEAKKLAEEIQGQARRTATHISVKDVQEQFSNAQEGFNRKVWFWGVLGAALVGTFISVAIFYHKDGFVQPDQQLGIIIYFTAIRLTVLTAIGAVATFSLKVFRAHMHMKEQNLHRQRVANSIAAFVESAMTPEQRDIILARLVDSVVEFGSSGLLSEGDDGLSPTKLAIDSITRTLPGSQNKG